MSNNTSKTINKEQSYFQNYPEKGRRIFKKKEKEATQMARD